MRSKRQFSGLNHRFDSKLSTYINADCMLKEPIINIYQRQDTQKARF